MGFNFGSIGPWVRGLIFGFENGTYTPVNIKNGKLQVLIYGNESNPQDVTVSGGKLYVRVSGGDLTSITNPVPTIPAPVSLLKNDSFTVSTTAAPTFGAWCDVDSIDFFGTWVQNFTGGNFIVGIAWQMAEFLAGAGITSTSPTITTSPGNQFYLPFEDPVNYAGAWPAVNYRAHPSQHVFRSWRLGFVANVASPALDITLNYMGR